MAQAKSETKSPLTGFDTTQFITLGQKQIDTFVEAQRELCNLIEHASRGWLAYIELERDLTSTLGKNMAASDGPEGVMKAYQEWVSSRQKALTERSKEFWSDSQKFVQSVSRLITTAAKGSGT